MNFRGVPVKKNTLYKSRAENSSDRLIFEKDGTLFFSSNTQFFFNFSKYFFFDIKKYFFISEFIRKGEGGVWPNPKFLLTEKD